LSTAWICRRCDSTLSITAGDRVAGEFLFDGTTREHSRTPEASEEQVLRPPDRSRDELLDDGKGYDTITGSAA
jgi:hypothetical protein